MSRQDKRFVWIDCEMTGLDPETDQILEIAVIITDAQLAVLDDPLTIVIQQPATVLATMGDWCKKQHTASGLIAEVQRSTTILTQAEQETLAYISYWCAPHVALLCGNTIYQDRAFLKKWMPAVEAYLHYRVIDVSTVKELLTIWYPRKVGLFKKTDTHRALADIRESLDELVYYRNILAALAPAREEEE